MHEHVRTWQRPPWFTRFTWDEETMLGERPRWGRWQDGIGVGAAERAVLGPAADRVRERLAAFGKGPDRFGLVHADMRLANLLLDDDQVYVIDFDDCGSTWYLYDVGTAVSFLEHDPAVPEWIASWIDGYRSVRHLAAEDEREIPTFVMLRRLMLIAWIGSHSDTELAQQMGEEYTRASCDLAERYLSTMARP
jgi:Ser/Thr protein kinase RdoA (MazF antagonist)